MDLFLAEPNRGGCPSVSDLTESEYSGRANHSNAFMNLGSHMNHRSLRHNYHHQHHQQQHQLEDHDLMHDDAMSAISERESSQPNESQDEYELLRGRRLKFFRQEEAAEDVDEVKSEHDPEPEPVSKKACQATTESSFCPVNDNPQATLLVVGAARLSFTGDHNPALVYNGEDNDNDDALSEHENNLAQASMHDNLNFGTRPGLRGWRRSTNNSNMLLQKANSVAALFHRKHEMPKQRKSLTPTPQALPISDQDLVLQLAALKLELAQLRADYDASQLQCQKLEEQNCQLQQQNAYLQEYDNSRDASLLQLQQEREEAESTVSKLKLECQELAKERDKKARDASDFRVALEACVGEINRTRDLLTSVQNSLDTETSEKEELREALKQQVEQVDILRRQSDEAAIVLRSMREQAQKASVERASLLKSLKRAQHDRDKLKAIAKERNVEIEAVKQELERSEKVGVSRPSRTHLRSRTELSPTPSSRSLGPIRWLEEMVSRKNHKKGQSDRSFLSSVDKKEAKDCKRNAPTGFQENESSSESDSSNMPSRPVAQDHLMESSSSKSPWPNPFLSKLLMHLPFFGASKGEVIEDNEANTAAKPASDHKKKKISTSFSKTAARDTARSSDKKRAISSTCEKSGVSAELVNNSSSDSESPLDRKKPASPTKLANKSKISNSKSNSKRKSRSNSRGRTRIRKHSGATSFGNEDSDDENKDDLRTDAKSKVSFRKNGTTLRKHDNADDEDSNKTPKSHSYKKMPARPNAVARVVKDGNEDDDSDDELKNIWASARQIIDCESSDDN